MRIMFLNQAPKRSTHYDPETIEAQLNSYASPGTKVEIGFPDDYEGAQVFEAIGAQSALNGVHHMIETPAIIRKIFWAAQNGYDAVGNRIAVTDARASNTLNGPTIAGRLNPGIGNVKLNPNVCKFTV